MLKSFYQKKELDYFSNVRMDIVEFIKHEKDLTILEIGGGSGSTLLYLKKKGIASNINLVDIVDMVEDKSEFDSIRIGDIENENLDYDHGFDIIILADVLEHLLEPKVVIKRVKEQLKKEGKILVSLPNIRHFSSFFKIFIKGSFKYEEEGIFDKTHLRFYCKSDMIQLFENDKDLKIKSIVPVNKLRKSKASTLDFLTFGFFSEFLNIQFLLEVQKTK